MIEVFNQTNGKCKLTDWSGHLEEPYESRGSSTFCEEQGVKFPLLTRLAICALPPSIFSILFYLSFKYIPIGFIVAPHTSFIVSLISPEDNNSNCNEA